ncbi:ABC transporter permease subunit [Rossellomorea oryzaecorticis]|uniref:ABC transporter permease subunit n=1 Tax=Rossellomorea oryzaecorticis TaxID=1396505 RepID=A0ABW8VMW8_9BACI|nr:ABC transporter permease subunit [Bacillus haikouensis]
MPKKIISMAGEVLLIITGIIFVSASSVLFENQSLSVFSYMRQIGEVFKDLLSPGDLVYVNPISDIERELFPILFLAYWSSARIFFLSLILALFFSVILLTFYFSMNRLFKKGVKAFSFLIGSLPDIFIIILTQLSIIWFFKKTGLLLIDTAAVGENQVILLPAVTLSVLPSFFFFSNMVGFLREEEGKPYVELAKSKGLTQFRILFIHMMRNVLVSLTYHGKQIAWMMISNLLILEYLFNVFGITSFLFTYNTPSIFAVASILLFLPLYLCLKLLQVLILNKTGKEMSL